MEHYKNLDLTDIVYFCEIDKVIKTEQWYTIPNYEGHYMVSNICRVKSLKNNTEKILSQWVNKRQYRYANICKNGEQKLIGLHVLMAITFMDYTVGSRTVIVDHKDNTRRFDNTVSNLQIITQRINQSKDRENKTSKFIGVCWNKKADKWKAAIDINGNKKHLGYFTDEEEASKYYQDALISINRGEAIKIKEIKYSSKYEGVSWCKNNKVFVSYITLNGKRKSTGSSTEEIKAYEKRAKALEYYKNAPQH